MGFLSCLGSSENTAGDIWRAKKTLQNAIDSNNNNTQQQGNKLK